MDRKEIENYVRMGLPELIAQANKVRQECIGSRLELCNILNAKSGLCSEDCRFCAQSGRHTSGIATHPLLTKDEIVQAAQQAFAMGAQRFGVVTSGNELTGEELDVIADAACQIRSKINIKLCASLGKMDKNGFSVLKRAGFSRYHHNIETSPRYFSKIVSSHTFQDRVDTIKAACEAGFEVCSGGIIGMGETLDDRIEMALVLKELDVDSVPINILVPIAGTPLASQEAISCNEVLRTIAIFRIILKEKTVKLAAGRETVLKDFQGMAFMAGANSMLIGGYLTIKGRAVAEDHKLIEEVKRLWQA